MSTVALVAAVAAVGVMQIALLTNDTSVKYVADLGVAAALVPGPATPMK